MAVLHLDNESAVKRAIEVSPLALFVQLSVNMLTYQDGSR